MRRSENGNVLFFILIAVALFAALGFAVSSGRDNSQGVASGAQANLDASEIIQFGTGVALTVEKLISIGGADDSNAGGNGVLFSATGADADYGVVDAHPSTEVFNRAGGSLTYIKPPATGCSVACVYDFTGQIIVTGMKDDTKHELSMIVLNVTPAVCTELNRVWQNGYTTIPTEDELTLERFDGTYGGTAITIDGVFAGNKGFCYRESGGGQRYIYVHVIKRR